jgi:hypothetical protein
MSINIDFHVVQFFIPTLDIDLHALQLDGKPSERDVLERASDRMEQG